jgi:uncharacterized membrane protein
MRKILVTLALVGIVGYLLGAGIVYFFTDIVVNALGRSL